MKIYNNTDGSTGILHSSKGNQLKMQIGDKWYKADFLGYEGASEYLASQILKNTNVNMFVDYELDEITYNDRIYNGCVSDNFLPKNAEIITAERIIKTTTGTTSYKLLNGKPLTDKIQTFVNIISDSTKLKNFGSYLTTLIELDAFTLNEDRHLHNIAVIKNGDKYSYCPIFDNGAAFLSDIRNDYPLEYDIRTLSKHVKAKPFHKSFDQQLNVCHELYGKQLQISKSMDLTTVYENIKNVYGDDIAVRMRGLVNRQSRIYQQFFVDNTKQPPVWDKPKGTQKPVPDVIIETECQNEATYKL